MTDVDPAGAGLGGVEVGGVRLSEPSNAAWFERARRAIPGGVDSPVRSFASVGGVPFTVAHGDGPWVYDVEGTKYLDFVQSYGAVLLGHAHPVAVDAVRRQAGRGRRSARRRRARSGWPRRSVTGCPAASRSGWSRRARRRR